MQVRFFFYGRVITSLELLCDPCPCVRTSRVGSVNVLYSQLPSGFSVEGSRVSQVVTEIFGTARVI